MTPTQATARNKKTRSKRRPATASADQDPAPQADRVASVRRHSKQSQEFAEQILRSTSASSGLIIAPKLKAKLHVPYSTITSRLRTLRKEEIAIEGHTVNPFRTRFCHMYRVSLHVNAHRINNDYQAKVDAECPVAKAAGGSIEWFLRDLIEKLTEKSNSEIAHHLVIMEAQILAGAPGSDIELTVISDDGIHSPGKFVRELVLRQESVVAATTYAIAWSTRFQGHAGTYDGTTRILPSRQEKGR